MTHHISLDYNRGHLGKSFWERWKRRTLLFVALLLMVGLWPIYRSISSLSMRWRTIGLQQQCATYAVASSTWAYVEDTKVLSSLTGDASYENLGDSSFRCALRKPPHIWVQYHSLFATPMQSQVWVNEPAGMSNQGTLLFMHSRKTTTGEERIVVVWLNVLEIANGSENPWNRLSLSTNVINPATLSSAPVLESESTYSPGLNATDVNYDSFTGHDLKIAMGEADPSDLARFTILWEIKGKPHRIAGKLEEVVVDGDLTVRIVFTGIPGL